MRSGIPRGAAATTAVAALALTAAFAPRPAVTVASASTTTGTGSFVTGVLPPPPPGSTTAYNVAAEPAIRADPAGAFYITSENGLGAGTEAWKSADGGLQYASLPQPNAVSTGGASGSTGLAPGGGDTDIAVAPVKDGTGYNVYAASLTLGDVTVSASADGGATWTSNVLSATVPVDDREWIAAAGPSAFYLSYHDVATGDQIVVNAGMLVGGTPASVATYSAINPAQTDIYLGTLSESEIGNIAVDPATGTVAQVFSGCPPSPVAVTTCQNLNTVYVAIGTPTGVGASGLPLLTFTDHVVFEAPAATTTANNFPNIAFDRSGNLYVAWSDGSAVFVSDSTDVGQSWSRPAQVNSGTATTAIYPWLTAGAAGKVDLVYYGTPAARNYQTCGGTTGQYTCQTEPWYVFFAQNLDAAEGGAWTQEQATGVVHYGGVCQGGISCGSTANDNRDLYDDFGVAASPVTGIASIAYSDDQWSDLQGSANAGACSSTQTNTAACDHTDFATQVGGVGIY